MRQELSKDFIKSNMHINKKDLVKNYIFPCLKNFYTNKKKNLFLNIIQSMKNFGEIKYSTERINILLNKYLKKYDLKQQIKRILENKIYLKLQFADIIKKNVN